MDCIFIISVRVHGQQAVNCFPILNCLAAIPPEVAVSQEECCSHASPPFGVAFEIPDTEICIPCPVGKFMIAA